jgi:hypothetical protein
MPTAELDRVTAENARLRERSDAAVFEVVNEQVKRGEALRDVAALAVDNARLKAAEAVVAEQSQDDRLWFDPVYATEAVLQQALRKLHEAIEAKTAEQCAAETIRALIEGSKP